MNTGCLRGFQKVRNISLSPHSSLMQDDHGVIGGDFVDEVGGPKDGQFSGCGEGMNVFDQRFATGYIQTYGGLIEKE